MGQNYIEMKFREWPKIIESVKSPLGLLALICIIVFTIATTLIINNQEEDFELKAHHFVVLLIFFIILALLPFVFTNENSEESTTENYSQKTKINNEIIIENSDLQERLNNIKDYSNEISTISNKTFQKIVLNRLDGFILNMRSWKNGELYVTKKNGQEFLIDIYQDAKENTFSTSYGDFIRHWTNEFGKRILNANQRSNSDVTRVFIFDKFSDLDSKIIEIIRKQSQSGIKVRLYFDAEDNTLGLDSETNRDYTIIDDTIVGITENFGINTDFRAKWHFKNQDLVRKLNIERQKLMRVSLTFEDAIKKYDQNKN